MITTTNNLTAEVNLKLDLYKPRDYQLGLIRAIEGDTLAGVEPFKKILCLWCRRSGKDLTAWNCMIRQAVQKVGVYMYCLPTFRQARLTLFDSMTNTGIRFLDYIPKELIASINSQEMKIRLINNSLIELIGSDTYDTSLVGTNPRMVVLSEYALSDERCYHYIRPIMNANNGIVVILSTPRGHNHFHQLYEIARNSPDWWVSKLTVEDCKHIPLSLIQQDIDNCEISEDMVQQEYYCFPSGQQVLTAGEIKNIEDIKEDDLVITHTGRPRRVLKTVSREYDGNLIILKTYGSPEEIRCTPNHPIRVYYPSTQTYLWKCADQLTVNDWITFPKMQFGTNPIISYELCMLMAWYITEGSSSKNILQFTLGNELEVAKVTNFLSALKIEHSINKLRTAYCVTVNDVNLIGFMKTNCGSMSYNKKIPFTLITGYENEFFNELMAGDGCFYDSIRLKKHIYATVSKVLAYQVQILANSLPDKVAGISIKQARQEYIEERLVNCRESYQVNIPIRETYSDQQRIIRAKHSIAAKIISINEGHYTGLVHNMKVQYDESYLVAGRAMHNCDFNSGQQGSYYGKYIDKMRLEGHIGQVDYESAFPVHTSWDLGFRDDTSIIFYQTIGTTVRIIDCYSKSKEGLEHYINVIKNKPYLIYGKHIAPHDIGVTEFASGQTRLQKAKQLGINFTLANNVSIMDGIESCRSAFSKIWIDEKKCQPLIKALEGYRQEYDTKRKVYNAKPLHDINSHFCFTEDTLLLTRNGMHPIINIENNDDVLTLEGWKPCTKSWIANQSANVVEVLFTDNTKVKCTPDHKFLTAQGWKSAEQLQQGSMIQSSLIALHNTLMDLYTDYILINDIFSRQNDYTEQYGNLLLDLYQKTVRFITKIMIPITTIYGISNVCQDSNILNNLDRIAKDLLRMLSIRQHYGIVPMLEGYGTVDMLERLLHGLNGNEKREIVYIAQNHLNVLFEKDLIHKNFVTQIAKRPIIESVTQIKQRYEVYDITVPNIGHFSLSNGAIVKNSDSFRYLCVSLSKTRDGLSAQDLDKRYQEAILQGQSNLPRPFKTDIW